MRHQLRNPSRHFIDLCEQRVELRFGLAQVGELRRAPFEQAVGDARRADQSSAVGVKRIVTRVSAIRARRHHERKVHFVALRLARGITATKRAAASHERVPIGLFIVTRRVHPAPYRRSKRVAHLARASRECGTVVNHEQRGLAVAGRRHKVPGELPSRTLCSDPRLDGRGARSRERDRGETDVEATEDCGNRQRRSAFTVHARTPEHDACRANCSVIFTAGAGSLPTWVAATTVSLAATKAAFAVTHTCTAVSAPSPDPTQNPKNSNRFAHPHGESTLTPHEGPSISLRPTCASSSAG